MCLQPPCPTASGGQAPDPGSEFTHSSDSPWLGLWQLALLPEIHFSASGWEILPLCLITLSNGALNPPLRVYQEDGTPQAPLGLGGIYSIRCRVPHRNDCRLTYVSPAAAESIFLSEWEGVWEAFCSVFSCFSRAATPGFPHPPCTAPCLSGVLGAFGGAVSGGFARLPPLPHRRICSFNPGHYPSPCPGSAKCDPAPLIAGRGCRCRQ